VLIIPIIWIIKPVKSGAASAEAAAAAH